jgi:hypothetical protein
VFCSRNCFDGGELVRRREIITALAFDVLAVVRFGEIVRVADGVSQRSRDAFALALVDGLDLGRGHSLPPAGLKFQEGQARRQEQYFLSPLLCPSCLTPGKP